MSSTGRHQWCEDEQLLHAIFHFKQQPASQLHEASHVAQLAATFQRFTSDLLAASSSPARSDRGRLQQPIWPCLMEQEVQALYTAAEVVSSSDSVLALPEFGCAMLVLNGHGSSCTAVGAAAAGTRLDELPVYLVALDGWGFHMHGWVGAQPRRHWLLTK
jgi:hypothetical protein